MNGYELSIKFFWKLPESVSWWYKTDTKTVSAISQLYHDDTSIMLATVLYVYIITRRVVWMESGFYVIYSSQSDMLKWYKCKVDPDQRTGSRNMGGGVIFKVRSTQDSFGAKVAAKYKGWSN